MEREFITVFFVRFRLILIISIGSDSIDFQILMIITGEKWLVYPVAKDTLELSVVAFNDTPN